MVEPFQVVWLFHGTARGQKKPRWMICILPDQGFFLPITSEPFFPDIPISKSPDHEWLDHDSHIECNILEYDEFAVEEAILDKEINYASFDLIDPILEALSKSSTASPIDIENIEVSLRACQEQCS